MVHLQRGVHDPSQIGWLQVKLGARGVEPRSNCVSLALSSMPPAKSRIDDLVGVDTLWLCVYWGTAREVLLNIWSR